MKRQDPFKREYISLSEIAKAAGVGRMAVYMRLKRRKVPYQKIGNIIVLKRADLRVLGY